MTVAEQHALVGELMAEANFVAIVQKLYDGRFTGETLIRWAEGHPRTVEIPQAPVRISLDSGRTRP